ncbi:hypothetical protein ACQHIV_37915 [Kribbella sp. GL6]
MARPAEFFHLADSAAAMAGLLALPEPPDDVFCYNDLPIPRRTAYGSS